PLVRFDPLRAIRAYSILSKVSEVRVRPKLLMVVHWTLGILSIVVLPVTSWMSGSLLFAWSMFSSSGLYRIDVTVRDARGRVRVVNPTELAPLSTPSTAIVLAGADHWRRGTSLALLRSHLEDLARFDCRTYEGYSAEVVLRERGVGGDTRSSA